MPQPTTKTTTTTLSSLLANSRANGVSSAAVVLCFHAWLFCLFPRPFFDSFESVLQFRRVLQFFGRFLGGVAVVSRVRVAFAKVRLFPAKTAGQLTIVLEEKCGSSRVKFITMVKPGSTSLLGSRVPERRGGEKSIPKFDGSQCSHWQVPVP